MHAPLAALPLPPVCCFTYSPPNPSAGATVQFTDCSTDPDDLIISWSWNFGDGTTEMGILSSHAFDSPGKYTVTLTVKDALGETGTIEIYINVRAEEESTIMVYLALIGIIVLLVLLFYPKGGASTPVKRSSEGGEDVEGPSDEASEKTEEGSPSKELDDIIDELEEDRKEKSD